MDENSSPSLVPIIAPPEAGFIGLHCRKTRFMPPDAERSLIVTGS